ncbi:circadian clock KaiB family protein [Limnoraphis robusta Tam1]|jgi:circadian clock protein KaiB|uniref:circadian clock KaiB family protein n=1 Tax=Limnoraphis robusta TaxID=1118279 RepID=UPI002B201134|nr:circadian clock KaiB family protein [Limnoraphis robusta]MEA5499525.1 circadian clock KaiB family protein [Limnoraphis robusta BA-68 BA1]MEA5538708.1 circadian clock KaiB family protein [Limnoraphis robusta Tam1]
MKEKSTENSIEAFEKVLIEKREEHYSLRLYIAGTTLQSAIALKNLKKICDEYLAGRHELEVIDIYKQPELLQAENIVAVPTLIKALPEPSQRMIGNLSDKEKVLMGLGLI